MHTFFVRKVFSFLNGLTVFSNSYFWWACKILHYMSSCLAQSSFHFQHTYQFFNNLKPEVNLLALVAAIFLIYIPHMPSPFPWFLFLLLNMMNSRIQIIQYPVIYLCLLLISFCHLCDTSVSFSLDALDPVY